MFEPWMIVVIAAVGLAAGTLGGMLGVGGSVIMIPALVVLFGQDTRAGFNQHLYQAAAMIVNVAVAVSSTYRHYKAGAIVPKAMKLMLPAALVMIFVGVAVSNLSVFDPGQQIAGASGAVWLGRVLAVFLVYVIVVNVQRLFAPRRETTGHEHVTLPRSTGVGSVMGFIAGLMGIGGGAVAVPLQQVALKLPLRNCIANSAAIICITAAFGAAAKNATLPEGCRLTDSLTLALLLAPTAFVGGWIGGKLTHVLPIRIVRGAFILLMIAAAWKMADLG